MRAVAFVSLAAFTAVLTLPACTRRETSGSDSPAGPSLVANAVAATSTARPGASEIGSAFGEPPAVPATPGVAESPKAARFVGRWIAEAAGNGMRCSWSGCYVVGRFKGTGVSARIRDEGFNLFQVVVDGEVKRVLRTERARTETVFSLAEGLPEGVHEIALHRRTEAKVGEVVFLGFEASNGGKPEPMMAAPPAPERRIETIGDSITTGFGNEGPSATCGWVAAEQNEYLTYGAIAARNLSADHTTLAWSGKTIREMHEYFDKSLPQRTEGPRWDFAQYQPQVVVLNVGTNNFALFDPGEARFVKVYVDLVARVRAAYPRAFIVCALGSMLSDVYPENRKNLTQARKYMKVTVAKLKESGDSNLEFLEFPEQNHADGLGCGFHPSLKTHKLMGDRLTAFIKEHVGW